MSEIKKKIIHVYFIFLVFLFAAISLGIDTPAGNCQCTPLAYEFKLKNNGAFTENYSLSVDLFPEYTTFSENPVSVNADAIKSVFVYVKLPCSIYGAYDINLIINAEKSKTTTKTPFQLNIVPCYDFNVELGNRFTITEEPVNMTFTAHKGAYSVCEGEKEAIPILITNNVDASNYKLKLKGKKWSVLSGNYLRLLKNQQGIVYLSLMPPEGLEETYELKLIITNENTKTKTTTPIEVKVEKCYGLELNLPVEQDSVCGCRLINYNLSVKNKGKFNEIVGFIIDAPRWVSLLNLSNQTLYINSSKEEIVELLVDVPCKKTGRYNIEIMGSLATNPKIEDNALIDLNVIQKDECYNAEIIIDESVEFDYSGAIKRIEIKNPIKKQSTYSITAEPGWVEVSPDTVTIKPNEIVGVDFIIKPTADIKEGRYYGAIKFESEDISFSKTINLELKGKADEQVKGNWYYTLAGILLVAIILFSIFMGKKIKKVKKGKKIERKKLFIYLIITLIILIIIAGMILIAYYGLLDYVLEKILWYKYYIYTLIALLIIILALIFIRKKMKKHKIKKAEEKEEIVEEEEIKVEAKKEKKVKKLKIEKFLGYVYTFLMVIIILGVIIYFFIYYKLIDKIKLIANYSTIDKIKEFISPYLNYLVGVVIILIVLIIILSIIKKIRKRKKKVKKIEAKKIVKKKKKEIKLRKNLFTYVVLLVIVGAIIYSFFYYDLIEYAENFIITYSYYILVGVLILAILIFILRFYKPILNFFMEEDKKK